MVYVTVGSGRGPARQTIAERLKMIWEPRVIEVGRGTADRADFIWCQRGSRIWKVITRGWVENKLSATKIILGSMNF